MANESPAFQYYPRDFLADTIHMTAEEVGAYWLILSTAWMGSNPGHVPNDHSLLALTGRLKGGAWKRCSKAILGALKSTDDGKWLYSKRMVEEWEKQKAHRKQASEAGKASAAARASGRNTPSNGTPTESQRPLNGEANGEATDSPTESNSASASALKDLNKRAGARVMGAVEQGAEEMGLLAAWEAAGLPQSPPMWTLVAALRALPESQRMTPVEVMAYFKRLVGKWNRDGLTTRVTVENLIKNLSILVQIHRGEVDPDAAPQAKARAAEDEPRPRPKSYVAGRYEEP